MQQVDLHNYKKLVIRDIQKQVQLKMIQKFLILNKSLDQIKSFNKVGNQIHLEFHKQKDAQVFISIHNHLSKIMLKKFNISYAFFTSQSPQKFPRYQVFGLNEQNRRNVYQFCCKYSPCLFELKYENNKLDPKSLIYFERFDYDQLKLLKNFLLTWNIKLRQEDNYGDFDKFRISIQLCDFATIQSPNLQQKQQSQLSKKLEAILKQITNEQPVGIEIHTYFHSQHKVKSYFRFKTVDLTFQIFEKLRQHLLNMPQNIKAKLFYFQKDSNSFYTLFTTGLLISQQYSQKKYEDVLLKAFRNINRNITQIVLNFKGSTYTGKLYFKTQIDSRDFLSKYGGNRQHYYMFYKPGFNVVIDIFQTQKQIKKQYQYQQNAQKMFSHFQQTRKEAEIIPIKPLQYGYPNKKYNHHYNKYDQYSRQNYRNNKYREKQTNQVQLKYREKTAEQPKQLKKAQKERDLKPKQDDFPTL